MCQEQNQTIGKQIFVLAQKAMAHTREAREGRGKGREGGDKDPKGATLAQKGDNSGSEYQPQESWQQRKQRAAGPDMHGTQATSTAPCGHRCQIERGKGAQEGKAF